MKNNYKYNLVWLVKDPSSQKEEFPDSIKLVKFDTRDALDELATAQFWISNCRLISFLSRGLEKKSNQTYIQTWHGFLGIKKVESDVAGSLSEGYIKYSRQDSSYIDFFISPSRFDSSIIRSSFWYGGELLECGYPRNDIFNLKKESIVLIINKLRERFNLSTNYGVVLYAPTFRNNNSIDVYNLDIDFLTKNLKSKFHKDFYTLIRLHPNISNLSSNFVEKHPYCIDVSSYSDMQELLLLADILITDYSSICFDFALSNKPVFLFATDINEYLHERGFYLDLNKLPYSISKSNDELMSNIIEFDYNSYLLNLNKFKQNQGYFEYNSASKEVCDLLYKKIAKFKENEEYLNYNYQYLKQYLYAVNSISKINQDVNNNLTIWQMWWQGYDNAPELVKKCLCSVMKFYPNNVVLITKDNFMNYVSIPKYILEKFEQGKISFPSFSDIVRTFLLAERGGIWIDATCLMTNKIPDEIISSCVFYFKSVTWTLYQKVPSEELLSVLLKIPTYLGAIHTGSSWFIVCKKGNELFTMMKAMICEYWQIENKAKDYFWFHLFLTILIINNHKAKNLYEKMISLSNREPHLLLNLLKEEYSQDLFNEIKGRTFIHKLTYKGLDLAKKNNNSFYNKILQME